MTRRGKILWYLFLCSILWEEKGSNKHESEMKSSERSLVGIIIGKKKERIKSTNSTHHTKVHILANGFPSRKNLLTIDFSFFFLFFLLILALYSALSQSLLQIFFVMINQLSLLSSLFMVFVKSKYGFKICVDLCMSRNGKLFTKYFTIFFEKI